MNDLNAFAKLVKAIKPWRAHLIFIGGWGHRLHTWHPQANKLDFQPIFTLDTDLAFEARAPMEGDIKAALQLEGFEEELTGEYKPPVAAYTLGGEQGGFYAEFLTPMVGSGITRRGAPDVTLSTAGISAQKIRHLDVLLLDPWVITVGTANGIPLEESVDLLVTNPLCFMVQKLLIKETRQPAAKVPQDLLYVHDTIQLFGGLLDEFKVAWEKTVMPYLRDKQAGKVLQEYERTFSQVTDDIRNAARIPQDRKLSAEDLQITCRYALGHVFGA